jgi:5,5'-dehydrodivanillate O-demethylase oxygenase subunit
MLSQEQNDRLTQVGPGTPMGELLRRYWYPVALVRELDEFPVKKVRLLGEDSRAVEDPTGGGYGIVQERAPTGTPRWPTAWSNPTGSAAGTTAGSSTARVAAWTSRPSRRSHVQGQDHGRVPGEAQALGGLVFAYIGPEPAPSSRATTRS